jgi:hypothetical protein
VVDTKVKAVTVTDSRATPPSAVSPVKQGKTHLCFLLKNIRRKPTNSQVDMFDYAHVIIIEAYGVCQCDSSRSGLTFR